MDGSWGHACVWGDVVLLIARTGVSIRGVKMSEGLCFTQGLHGVTRRLCTGRISTSC